MKKIIEIWIILFLQSGILFAGQEIPKKEHPIIFCNLYEAHYIDYKEMLNYYKLLREKSYLNGLFLWPGYWPGMYDPEIEPLYSIGPEPIGIYTVCDDFKQDGFYVVVPHGTLVRVDDDWVKREFSPIDEVLTYPVTETGEPLNSWDLNRDKLNPNYLKYSYRLIDGVAKMKADVFALVEYNFDQQGYSKAAVDAFRKDLSEEDDGIDWICNDGKIEHINFWGYAQKYLGINKKNYKPSMIGAFLSYKEYLPAPIRGGGDVGDFLGYIPYKPMGSGGAYFKNIELYQALIEYEFFKIRQKQYKYAKSKGIPWCQWGENWQVGENRVFHDPYVDYVSVADSGIRDGGPGRNLVLPGGRVLDPAVTFRMQQQKPYSYYIKGMRQAQLLNEKYQKSSMVSYESVEIGRFLKSRYNSQFFTLLLTSALSRPRLIMTEFGLAPVIFSKTISSVEKQQNMAILDGIRISIDAKINELKTKRSNWLIQTSRNQFEAFASFVISDLANTGDMRAELYVEKGYIPDIETSNGTERELDLDDYKVVTMGGEHFSDYTVSALNDWLTKGEGRTLFVNSSNFGRSNVNYFDLGIWKTSILQRYRIKEITYVDHDIFPGVKPGKYSMVADMPVDILDSLPLDSQVVMRGLTEDDKEEVPLVVIIPKGENQIINITFPLEGFTVKGPISLKETAEFILNKQVMFDLFDYIEKKYNFSILRIETKYPMDILFRVPALTNKGVSVIVAQGSASLGEEKYWNINPVVLSYENSKVESMVDDQSGIIAALDGSILSSVGKIKINDKLYVKTSINTPWVISTLDEESYEKSKTIFLWTKEATEITMLGPALWTDKDKIKVRQKQTFREIGYKLNDGYINFKTIGGEEYLVEYKIERKPVVSAITITKEVTKERFNDSVWEKKKITSAISNSGILDYVFVYRKHIIVPEKWQKKSLVLELGVSYHSGTGCKIYFNSQEVGFYDGEWEGPNSPRRCIISKELINYGGDNVIALKLYRGSMLGGGPIRLLESETGEEIDLSELEWLYKKGNDSAWMNY